jgi:L-threonylcarbamoyladenylate synthase
LNPWAEVTSESAKLRAENKLFNFGHKMNSSSNPWILHPRIRIAASAIKSGGIVAYPTEAVWGLGCDPFNPRAVDRLLQIKQRPLHKGVILLAADFAQVENLLTHLSAEQIAILKASWPGPVTWLIPNTGSKNKKIPEWICGQYPAFALRVTNHPIAAALAKAVGGPIVSTSCNPSNQLPAKTIHQVHKYFPSQLDAILAGNLGKNKNPSEIRDLLTGKIIRQA